MLDLSKKREIKKKREKEKRALSENSETAEREEKRGKKRTSTFLLYYFCISFFQLARQRWEGKKKGGKRKTPVFFFLYAKSTLSSYSPKSAPRTSLDGFTLASASTGLSPTAAMAGHSAACAL